MSNILLFFMSYYSPMVENGHYKRTQTNEAALFHMKQDRPDKIIALCSEKVRKFPSVPALDGGASMTTLDYFLQSVLPAAKLSADQLVAVPVPDSMTEAAQAAAIAQIVRNVQAGDTLYIDLSGGMRDTAMLMVAVARYLRDIRDVRAHIFYTELQGDSSVLRNSDKLYDLFDLISATDEFFSTGRAEQLSFYLYHSSVQSASTAMLLKSIESFSKDLLLCKADKVLDDISALKKALTDALRATDIPRDNLDALLYDLLNEGFKREFKNLDRKSGRALPALVRWCLNHELYQQALTLLSEQMPVFVCSHIFVQPTQVGLDFLSAQVQNKGKKWPYPLFHFHFCRLALLEVIMYGEKKRYVFTSDLRLSKEFSNTDENQLFRVAKRQEVSNYLFKAVQKGQLIYDKEQRSNLLDAIVCYQKVQQYRNQINHASDTLGLLPLTVEDIRAALDETCTCLEAIVGLKPKVNPGAQLLPPV